MVTNKDFDDLAKKADNGLHGLGRIVKAIEILDQKGTQQHNNMVKWAKWSIVLTAIILVFTILAFFNISADFKKKPHIVAPDSHTNNIKDTVITTNKIDQNKPSPD